MNFMYGLCFAVAAPAILSQAGAGIGVTLGKDGDNIVVKSVIPDSAAAWNKEIHIGDRIIAVAQNNDAPAKLQGMTLTEAVGLIRGPRGTTVRLTIVPEGKGDTQARVVSLVRGEIKNLASDGVLVPFDIKNMPPEIYQPRLPPQIPPELVSRPPFWATWSFWKYAVFLIAPFGAAIASVKTFKPVARRDIKPIFIVLGISIICISIGIAVFTLQTEGPFLLFIGGLGLLFAGFFVVLAGLPIGTKL